MAEEKKDLVPQQQQQGLVRSVVEPKELSAAVLEYKGIQEALDKALPDCLMKIQGRNFRKKNYWRAVTAAFNLTVQMTQEELVSGKADWGYVVTYRATAPNGRTADGDGACFKSEKSGKMATVHNVRSHAHTRAYNRAVSNLVGFGEVSAEEVDRQGHYAEIPTDAPDAEFQEVPASNGDATQAVMDAAEKAGLKTEDLRAYVKSRGTTLETMTSKQLSGLVVSIKKGIVADWLIEQGGEG